MLEWQAPRPSADKPAEAASRIGRLARIQTVQEGSGFETVIWVDPAKYGAEPYHLVLPRTTAGSVVHGTKQEDAAHHDDVMTTL